MSHLLTLSFTLLLPIERDLLHLGFVQNQKVSGSLLDLGFTQIQKKSGNLLNLSFEVSPLPKHRFHFRGSQTQANLGDFDVRVFLKGKMLNACEIAETMSIQRGENESSLCEFVLLPPRERKNPQPIDLFQWYQQYVQVHIVSARENLCIFKGVVDSVDFTMLKGRVLIRCSDRRDDGLMSLHHDFVKEIGFTSKSAHGDVFESIKDEVEARLQTVPASLERNLGGDMVLTDWQPGPVRHTVSRCAIYQREPELSLVEVGGVLGSVEITLNLDYARLIERNINISIASGLSVCDYGKYSGLMRLEDAVSAISQTEWAVGAFQAERVEPNGWYTCGGKKFALLRDVAMVEKEKTDENGKKSDRAANIEVVSRKLNTVIKSGNFNASKRWQQKIREVYRITLSSGAPSTRKQAILFNISLQLPENLEWKAKSVHEKEVQFDYDKYRFWHHQANVIAFPRPLVWQVSEFGDIYADLADESHEFKKTEKVAYETAKTMIFQTHRNRIKFEMKFLATASVQQSHRIEHSHFKGVAKVCAVRHHFDFNKGLAKSELTYAFSKKLGNGGAAYREIERQPLDTFPFSRSAHFGRVEIGGGDTIGDGHVGLIYRQVGKSLFHLEKLVVRSPEVEANSTDNREVYREEGYGVSVPDSNVEILI